MTDAYIRADNDTNCVQEITDTANEDTTVLNNATSLEGDNDCNITNDFNPNQNQNLLTLHISANVTSSKKVNNIKNAPENCGEDIKTMTDECLKILSKLNEVPKGDSVLKYVYKKDEDKSVLNKKSPGHPLNSLRKKRSLNSENNTENTSEMTSQIVNMEPIGEIKAMDKTIAADLKIENNNLTAEASETAPLIVNYETAHKPESNIEVSPPLFQRQTENTIQNSALADFNIQTLHTPNEPQKKYENVNENSSSRSDEDSRESSERKSYPNNDRSYSDESSEDTRENVRPNSDYKTSRPSRRDSDETRENDDSRVYPSSNQHSREENDRPRHTNYRENKNRENDDDESEERQKYKNLSSNEDNREIIDEDIPHKPKTPYNKYRIHTEKPNKEFEEYNNPRHPKSDFEKYKDDPRSFEKYEDKEISPNSAENTKLNNKGQNDVSNEKYLGSSQSIENSESAESNDSAEPSKAPYKKHTNDDVTINHRENSKEERNSNYGKGSNENSEDTKYNTREDSGQSEEHQHKEYSKKPNEQESNSKKQPLIQDVDLGDFSYEKVQVNDKGKIVPAQESDDYIDKSNEKNYSDDKHQNIQSSEIDEQLKSEIYESIKQPVRINGEIKPVVEINSEINEGENSEENSKEAFKSVPQNDVSLESILGTNNDKDVNEPIEKTNNYKEKGNSGDVKQQFERIPTDYKHENKEDTTKNTQKPQINKPSVEHEEVQLQGTLDTFTPPKDENFDEHLKFKFDDVAIKLPEIKLPEDVLAYTYEEPSYEKKRGDYKKRKNEPKEPFFHYNDEYVDRPHKDKDHDSNEDEDDDDHEYYGYHNDKQNLKKKKDDEEEDEDVDLYEKFVRERFGKQGSFEKRSEKLQNERTLPYNPELYAKYQNILQKTAQIDEQAKKSGDPNAGYMWTLQYGEKL